MLLSTDVSPWLAVFGRFHIVLLHLPIGLIPGMFLLEMGAVLIRRPAPRGALIALAVLTALTAGLALASGLVLAAEHEHPLLGKHKNYAIALTAVCALLPIMALLKSRRPFRIGLGAALALSIPTGHLGGSMTHRSDFLFKPLELAGQKANEEQNGTDGEQDGANGEPVTPPPAEQTHFEKVIAPIFERTCNACHSPDTEGGPEGDLILTTREGILCLDRDEVDRVIVPGDPDNSYLMQVCEYPLDDEDHMPPKDEPQPTKAELAALRQWIKDGAKFD